MHYDVLIMGAGLAGITVALSLPRHLKIALLCKADLNTCSSDLAQGGIAAVLDPKDHVSLHVQDTLVAGAGLCEPQQVEQILQAAPQAIDWLCAQGVPFSCEDEPKLHLTCEGGHTQRRIVHVADHTGHAVMVTLQQKLKQHTNITYLPEHSVEQLLGENGRCIGAKLRDVAQQSMTILAKHNVLATGGMGQLFQYTTNPTTATGDGVALAWQAGCRVANLEFIQFHPTALALQNANGFLISEALRGEGGILRDPKGRRFMPEYDARAELAPRDIVARAIANEMQQQQAAAMYLDMTQLPAAFIQQHFPAIYQHCLSLNLDICREQIPIAPAAHYACGGVVTNSMGQSDVVDLYAVGEVAYTGLHGANRLASNSLLECVVIGRRVAECIAHEAAWKMVPAYPQSSHLVLYPRQHVTDQAKFSLQLLQQQMSQHFGIQRDFVHMQQLYQQVLNWRQKFVQENKTVPHVIYTALLMLKSALQRTESRGTHFNRDCPYLNDVPQLSVIEGLVSRPLEQCCAI
ncbi:L-aspartate oxidase [Acinetobacter sp. MD2]|nr:L-aspartate oxidase [Acinetobacter sp. MD2]